MISIIIPALNEAHSIGATLAAASRLSVRAEVIVVDGGSDDGTREIARARGAKVIASERGRGAQMHEGARAAQGDVLWFLHADTIVPAAALDLIVEALRDPQVVAGNFEVHFDGQGRSARFMTWLYPRLRRLGLYYGDSAIFVRRETYEHVGGFEAFPIFEDLDLMKRARKWGRMVHLPAVVVTSSRRFEGRSFPLTFARWASLQLLYWLGVGPFRLGRLYAPIRQTGRPQFAVAGQENRSQRPATN
jgi:rSAM/selenodomain-associated transferase 2